MGDADTPKLDAGAQALQSDLGAASDPPPPKGETVFGTIMVPSAEDSDPTSATVLSAGTPPPGTPPPATRTPRPGKLAAAPPVAVPPTPRVRGNNRRILLPVWLLCMFVSAGVGAVLSRASMDRAGAGVAAPRMESPATENERTQADLEEQVALLTADRERLLALHADLRDSMTRLREPQATAATVRLDAPISLTVEEAACTVTLHRVNSGMPHLQVQIEVTNQGPRALPGVMQLTFLDESLTEVGRANFNLFGEGAFEDLRPGERRVMRGSVRIRTSRRLPTHFWLLFVR